MNISIIINSIGLLFDIAGAILIFKNTPKANFSDYYYDQNVIEKMKIKARKMNKRVRLGASFLFIGFLFQLISNFFE